MTHDLKHEEVPPGLQTPDPTDAHLLNMTQYSLFTQVPSGKMSRGVVSGEATCAFMRSPTRRRSPDCRDIKVLIALACTGDGVCESPVLACQTQGAELHSSATKVLAVGHVLHGAGCSAVTVN